MATSAHRSHSGITPSNPAHGAGKEQAAGALQRLRAARDSKQTNSSILEARPKPSADIDRVRLVHLPVLCRGHLLSAMHATLYTQADTLQRRVRDHVVPLRPSQGRAQPSMGSWHHPLPNTGSGMRLGCPLLDAGEEGSTYVSGYCWFVEAPCSGQFFLPTHHTSTVIPEPYVTCRLMDVSKAILHSFCRGNRPSTLLPAPR